LILTIAARSLLEQFKSDGEQQMAIAFAGFDFAAFWKRSEYATKNYVGPALTDQAVAVVVRQLGFELPPSYVEFMRYQNGGIPCRRNHRTNERTSWANDHVAITGLYSIGGDKPCSLLGTFGSSFWVKEWGYPPIGVYFADCPSAGHDMLCLDYRTCGTNGEPRVVHVDQEWGYKIVLVADTFEAFIRGLEDDTAFDLGVE
jgi:hypothetical protein